MATVSTLEVTNVFADDTTLKISVNNIRPENLNTDTISQTVKQFNDAKGGTLTSKLKSKNGFNWIGIKKVRIVTKEIAYIF